MYCRRFSFRLLISFHATRVVWPPPQTKKRSCHRTEYRIFFFLLWNTQIFGQWCKIIENTLLSMIKGDNLYQLMFSSQSAFVPNVRFFHCTTVVEFLHYRHKNCKKSRASLCGVAPISLNVSLKSFSLRVNLKTHSQRRPHEDCDIIISMHRIRVHVKNKYGRFMK